jgi:hypothetical protein
LVGEIEGVGSQEILGRGLDLLFQFKEKDLRAVQDVWTQANARLGELGEHDTLIRVKNRDSHLFFS